MTVSSMPRWKKNALLFLLMLMLPFGLIFLFPQPDMSDENLIDIRISELRERLVHAQTLNNARHEDVMELTGHFVQLLQAAQQGSPSDVLLDIDAQRLLHNMSQRAELYLPSVYTFLPHLMDHPDSLAPAFKKSQGRDGVSMVLGIPTVRREVQSYLLSTVSNLLHSMTGDEQDDTLIVIFVADSDVEYVQSLSGVLEHQFQWAVDAGLLEVVSPPASYYPDLSNLKQSLGDPPERVKWRTKQNLDFAFLMMYCQPKGTFYVQLEDDILTKPSFISTMKKFALKTTAKKEDWLVLDFCQLGFIGKLFKCSELGILTQFILMFYKDKPVDWLLDNLVQTRACRLDKDSKACRKAKDKLWVPYKPSLFQHIGTHSSLKGKVQKLKDKQFGKVPLFFAHKNPPARVESGIKSYKTYSLQRAYQGETYFWGLLPQKGDQMLFHFTPPVGLKRYLFRSGNIEHPSDILYSTTVEILPETITKGMNTTDDGFVIMGMFDDVGLCEGSIDSTMGSIQILRLRVHADSEHWAIISEIYIETKEAR